MLVSYFVKLDDMFDDVTLMIFFFSYDINNQISESGWNIYKYVGIKWLTLPRSGAVKLPPPPQTNLLAAVSDPHGTNRNALMTFPEYGWATKWHNYCIYVVTQKSQMATANGSYFLKNFKKTITQFVCKISCIIPYFLVQEFNEASYYIVWCKRKSEIQDSKRKY